MNLLWRGSTDAGDRVAPGPKPGLSVNAIVAAGIEVADAQPLAKLSMRAVADRLGRTAMALYTYVPGKAELVDLMYDEAHAEFAPDDRPSGDWASAVTAWANELLALYLRHPWLTQVSFARPVLGPHEQAVLEHLAAVLLDTGLPAERLRGIVAMLFQLVRGSAQTIAQARQAVSATGVSDQDWWVERSEQLSEVAPDFAARFPASVKLAQSTAPPKAPNAADADESHLERQARASFAAGLEVILAGISASIAH